MFNKIKNAISLCLSAICVDHVSNNIYEVPADQAKFIMGK